MGRVCPGNLPPYTSVNNEDMKILHISDLHLGKRVLGFPMLEDQNFILKEILEIVGQQHPQAVVIAGDVFDKGVPSVEAIAAFDGFLVALSKFQLEVFVVSGNHDQAERLSFGSRLMIPNIHIAPAYNGAIQPVVLNDEYGEINIYMLPFIKPGFIRPYTTREIDTYQDAVAEAVNQMAADPAARNVLVAHQFVTADGSTVERCDSEEFSVGGIDNIDAQTFSAFDYVALGHLHRAQQVSRPSIRYSGSPLKYSFSEIHHKKSVTIVELKDKEQVEVSTIELKPLTDMGELKGRFDELTDKDYYLGKAFRNYYLRVVLTDEQDVPDAFGRLRNIYPNLMELGYDNHRTRATDTVSGNAAVEVLQPLDILKQLYSEQNKQELSQEMEKLANELIEKIWN